MYTLRCTRKLLARIDERPSSEGVASTTVLGDWYANLLYRRPRQLVLAMNERTLLCALVPAAPAATVVERLRVEIGGLLTDIGVAATAVDAELAAMRDVAIGATASRAVLGCMKDAALQLDAIEHERPAEASSRAVALHLADNLYSYTDYQRPWVHALALFGVAAPARGGRRWVLH